MAKRRIKFIWGGAEQVPGEWTLGVWGVYERDPGSRVKGVAVSVRGVLRALAIATVAGYLAGAVALFAWFTRNPYNHVRFVDTLLLPFRWSHVREVRGRMMIEEGLDDLKAQRWAEANMKLHAGLSRAPHDLRARLSLAQFSVLANRRPEALKILSEDLGHGYPGRKYLETLFAIAAEGEDFEVVIQTCERFANAAAADEAWLLALRVQALVHAGRAEEVVRLVDEKGDQADEMLKEAKVLALFELKRPAEAVAFLERWRGQPGANPQQIVRLEVRAYREAGRLDAMETAWNEFRKLAPTDPRTYGYGVVQRVLAGQTEAAREAMEDYFRRFSAESENITLLASALAEAKAPALVQRCVEEGANHGFPRLPLQFALLQAQLATADWRGAEGTLVKLRTVANSKNVTEKFIIEWMTNLVGVVAHQDEGAQATLLEFLQARPMSMRIYRLTCEPLVAARRFVAADKVLELAEHAYPESRTLAQWRAQVTEGLKPATPAAVVAAQPGAAGANVRTFFESLETAQKEGRWKDVANAVHEIRVAKPAWLAAREPDLLEWQMRAGVKTGDTAELLGAATFYLDGSTQRAVKAFELAQELDAAGHRDDAERLLKEVLRKNPDFPAVTRLLKQWKDAARKAEKAGAKKR